MIEKACQRTGVRVKVNNNDGIEAVIYADELFPDFCANYEINLGGLKIFSALETDLKQQLTIRLFGKSQNSVSLAGHVVSIDSDITIIAFEKLDAVKTAELSAILELQQAL